MEAIKKRVNWWLVGILGGVLLLRIPSFFEPYWYGDEGIYLVLGQMLRRGAVLYRDIWDNKPPLLYLLYSLNPTLLWAKVSAAAFVLSTTAVVYFLAKRLFADDRRIKIISLVGAGLTGVLLSIPLMEGTIANAELYFTLPIAIGAAIIFKSLTQTTKVTGFWLGFLAAIAFLLKVPAAFDFVGLVLAYLVIKSGGLKGLRSSILDLMLPAAVVFLAFLVLTAGYFFLNHALGDFLTASFSQNATYVSVDSGPLSRLNNPLFIKGVVLVAATLLTIWGYRKKRISRELLFLLLWFGFSLYGALLSNRPYMHYLLQVVPPAVLLLIYFLADARRLKFLLPAMVVVAAYLVSVFKGAFALNTVGYYHNFWDYISERETWEDYVNYFDTRTLASYRVADYIKANTKPDDPIFVWGDASFIYVLSGRMPVAKFIQAHHLSTIDPKNYDLILSRINRFQPKLILIGRPVNFQFPSLEFLVYQNYRPTAVFSQMYIYKNVSPVTAPAWSPGPI